MRLVEPIWRLVADSELCCQFREDLEIDGSFLGWMRAFRHMLATFAFWLIVIVIGLALIGAVVFRASS